MAFGAARRTIQTSYRPPAVEDPELPGLAFDPANRSPNTGVTGGQPLQPVGGPAPQTSPFNREQFRDQWLGTRTDLGAQNTLLSQYGLSPSANGTVTLPTGEVMDLRRGAKAGINEAQWLGVGSGLKYGQNPAYASPQAGGVEGMTAGAASAANDPFSQAIRDQVLQLLRQPTNPSETDIQSQYQPALNAMRRAALEQRGASAERLAAQGFAHGGKGGALDAEVNAINEQSGEAQGRLVSQVMAREIAGRRQQIAQALQVGAGILSNDQRAALQRELAQLDASLRRYGIDTSAGLQRDQMGLTADMFQANMQNDWLDRLFGGGRGQPWG